MIEGLEITEDDLSGADVQGLVALHLGGMHAESPADKVHALPLDKLRQPGVTFYTARIDGALAAMARSSTSTRRTANSNRCAPPPNGEERAWARRCCSTCSKSPARAAIPA